MRLAPGRSLAEALAVTPRELVALVGAGGKTSLLYRLARELAAAGVRTAAATTTKILPPGPEDGAELALAETWEDLAMPASAVPVFGRRLLPNGKVEGIPPAWCDRLVAEGLVDALVVEADGARRLPLKAPSEDEPVVPGGATLFVAVVGLSCLGRPLGGEVAFRPERVAAAAGVALGARITPALLTGLLATPGGLLQGRPPAARAAVFLNQADGPAEVAAGREVASALLEGPSPWERVIVGHLRASEPVEEAWVR